MKLPKLDMDRSWAYEDWNKYAKVVSVYNKVNKTIGDNKKRIGAAIAKGAKVVAKSPLLKKFTVDKFIANLKVEKIGSNTYRIAKQYVFQSYLIVGRNKALLIDTGLGIGSLLDTVREITDKPLIVVCTHGHFGCVGGAGEFDEVLLSKYDIKIAKRMYNTLHKTIAKYNKDHVVKEPNFVPIDKKYLKDERIDLGGRKIHVKEVPSHTKGSLCFYDDKFAFTGDIMGPFGFHILPGAVPMNLYADNFNELYNKFLRQKIYCSYLPKDLKRDSVAKAKTMVYFAAMGTNNYRDLIRFRHTDDWKQFMLYYGYKANRRDRENRWDAIKTRL